MFCRDTACLWPVEPAGEACGDPGTHSHMADAGACLCDDGYDWCDPDDPDDYRCCASNFDPCASGSNNHVNNDGAEERRSGKYGYRSFEHCFTPLGKNT